MWVVIAAVAVVVILAVAFWMMQSRRKSSRLREGFGPEYERTVQDTGDKRKAERDLEARQKRVAALDIRPLKAEDQAKFSQQWTETQTKFVDSPSDAIVQADRLVVQVMQVRGYPVGDFDRRTEDISVDHPQVVPVYRTAHETAEKNARGEATTEDLRQAMVQYRVLFNELLETGEAPVDDHRTVSPGREGDREPDREREHAGDRDRA